MVAKARIDDIYKDIEKLKEIQEFFASRKFDVYSFYEIDIKKIIDDVCKYHKLGINGVYKNFPIVDTGIYISNVKYIEGVGIIEEETLLIFSFSEMRGTSSDGTEEVWNSFISEMKNIKPKYIDKSGDFYYSSKNSKEAYEKIQVLFEKYKDEFSKAAAEKMIADLEEQIEILKTHINKG